MHRHAHESEDPFSFPCEPAKKQPPTPSRVRPLARPCVCDTAHVAREPPSQPPSPTCSLSGDEPVWNVRSRAPRSSRIPSNLRATTLPQAHARGGGRVAVRRREKASSKDTAEPDRKARGAEEGCGMTVPVPARPQRCAALPCHHGLFWATATPFARLFCPQLRPTAKGRFLFRAGAIPQRGVRHPPARWETSWTGARRRRSCKSSPSHNGWTTSLRDCAGVAQPGRREKKSRKRHLISPMQPSCWCLGLRQPAHHMSSHDIHGMAAGLVGSRQGHGTDPGANLCQAHDRHEGFLVASRGGVVCKAEELASARAPFCPCPNRSMDAGVGFRFGFCCASEGQQAPTTAAARPRVRERPGPALCGADSARSPK